MSWLGEYLKREVAYQLSNHSAVRLAMKYHDKLNKFYIDSKAGLLVYKPKDLQDMTRFRNKWINKFETLREKEVSGENIDKELFKTYSEIIKTEKISYEANINTRLKRNLWNLKNLY